MGYDRRMSPEVMFDLRKDGKVSTQIQSFFHAVTMPDANSTESMKQTNGVNGQAPTGWNGTFMTTKDSYALKRDCNANSRYVLV